jgi:hypothetical protein
MSHLDKKCHPGRLLLAALAGVLAAGLWAGPVRAKEGEPSVPSLKWVPEDAAFYCSMLRNREQFEAMAGSRAWAKLKALPFVKDLWKNVREELTGEEGRLAGLYKFFQGAENQQLAELLGEMVSREVFVYGGDNWAGTLELAQEFQSIKPYLNLSLFQLAARGGGGNPSRLLAQTFLRVLAANTERVQVPELVVGFRLGKTGPAEAQLRRLEKLLDGLAKKAAPLKGRFKREKVAGGDFLTLQLDGGLVPWDQVPVKGLEVEAGDFDALVKKLKGLKLTLSVGLRDRYLLVALGGAANPVALIARGKPLAGRRELKPLARFADKRLCFISYVSRGLNTILADRKRNLDGLLKTAEVALPLAPLAANQRDQILKDLKDLVKDLKAVAPETGARLSFSFLTSRGWEGYAHDWGKYPDRDGSKPLSLLNHAGGDPLLAVLARSRVSAEQYRLLVKWIRVGHRYFQEYVVPSMDEEVRENYPKFARAVWPLLKRLDEVTAKMLLPALADGQTGLVLDGKWKSRQWFEKIPGTEKALPLLEPALLFGVSDAARLRKAFGEYRSIANQLLAGLHELAPDRVPELKVRAPRTKKLAAGALYFYPVPEGWGIDGQVVPTAGLGDRVAALTVSQKQAERLLVSTPLKVKGGPLGDPRRKLAMAMYLNWPGVVDALVPWVEMGVRTVFDQLALFGNEEAVAQVAEGVVKQVRGVAEVLKVFRSYASGTYVEDGAWVTHCEFVIRDLENPK